MSYTVPRYRRPLNDSQLYIMRFLYAFRFGTIDSFTQSYGQKIRKQNMEKKLRNLQEQEYIGRRYDTSYKLLGRPASYYLAAKGIKILKEQSDEFKPEVLRKLARDRNRSDSFISHWLGVFDIHNRCRRQYGADLLFFAQSDIIGQDTFPRPLPDAYVALANDRNKHCFLEYFESSTQFFVTKKRIRYYAEFAEDNDLSQKELLPTFVFVCNTDELKQKVLKEATKRFENSWMEIPYVVLTKDEVETVNLFAVAEQTDTASEAFLESPDY